MNDSVKQATIDRIIDARLIRLGEQAKLVDNGLGAREIFFPSDCAAGRDDTLWHKCQRSVDYAMSMSDDAVFNAMQYMVPEVPANSKVLMGFYLMLADTVSRNPMGKTFLTAMREAGAELTVDVKDITPAIKKELYEKMQKAIAALGLTDKCASKVTEWYEKGQFTFAGIPHGVAQAEDAPLKEGEDPNTPREKIVRLHEAVGTYRIDTFNGQELVNVEYGPYTELAHLVFALEPDYPVSANVTVSVAKARQEDQLKMGSNTTEEEVVEKSVKPLIDNAKLLVDVHLRGRFLRADRMYQAVKTVNVFTQEEVDEGMAQEIRSRDEIARILSYIPESTLAYIEKKKITLAFTHDESIRSVYPKENLPGLTVKDAEGTRDGMGVRLSRYDTMFISAGRRAYPADMGPEQRDELRTMRLAQTALHELFHEMFAQMPDETCMKLLKQMHALKTIDTSNWPDEDLMTLPGQSLRHVVKLIDGSKLDDRRKPSMYANYLWANQDRVIRAQASPKEEEALCNFFSLLNTELRDSRLIEEVPELRSLRDNMNAALRAVVLPRTAEQTVAANNDAPLSGLRNVTGQGEGQGGGTVLS